MYSECKSETVRLFGDRRGVVRVQLSRPEVHNSFNDEMIVSLKNNLDFLKSDPAVRIVVLTGSGKHFCAGADLTWMKKSGNYTFSENKADALKLAELFEALYFFPKPTLVQIQGACFGGAVGLVSCCDIAFSDTTARFCLSEVKLGLIPAIISPYVIRAIGARQALRMMQTAEEISAPEALRLGLIHHCVENEKLESMVEVTINKLLHNAPVALREIKALVHQIQDEPLGDSLKSTLVEKIAEIRGSAEAQEGLAAYLAKRAPHY